MSIVQELVKKMNGTIKVESKIDEGTQFIVQLPLEIDLNPVENKSLKIKQCPLKIYLYLSWKIMISIWK